MRRVHDEIREFHACLAAWLSEGAEEAIRRLEEALAPELVLVDLHGEAVPRERVVAALRGAGASRSGVRIDVEGATVLELTGGWWLATFVERHSVGEDRRTTAILREDAAAPGGLLWVHVHETALRGAA